MLLRKGSVNIGPIFNYYKKMARGGSVGWGTALQARMSRVRL
jgi:hypothetical protein